MNAAKLMRWKALALRAWRLCARRDLQALGMCAACAVLYFGAIRPERERLEQAQRQAASLQRERTPRLVAAEDPAASELDRFYARFPSQDAFPNALDRLLRTAATHSLSLNEGEYTVTRETAGKLVRFQIVLPLRGNYPQVRSFLAALAQEVPGMALENAQFERRDLGDPALDVKLRLVLFLAREP
jgi:Tfp pilus assembly protein PilO